VNEPMIEVYTRENCDICKRFKARVIEMGFKFDEKNINDYIEYHEDWRERKSYEVSAALTAINDGNYPVIKLNGEFVNFAKAINTLKEIRDGSKA